MTQIDPPSVDTAALAAARKKELTLAPLGNMHVVILEDAITMTAGGIHLPAAAQEAPCVGTIIASGPGLKSGFGAETIQCQCGPGDKILLARHAVLTCVLPTGESFSMVHEGDVYAKIKLIDPEEA